MVYQDLEEDPVTGHYYLHTQCSPLKDIGFHYRRGSLDSLAGTSIVFINDDP